MATNSRARVRRLRAPNPGKAVGVWARDEARLGPEPVTRRAWWPRGCRPRACGRTEYGWLYVHASARPAAGETFTAILPRVKAERTEDALAALAAHADPSGKKVLALVPDNAGWHRAKGLTVPANVRLHPLPPSAPELQPVEPFRPLVRGAVADDTFARLADPRRRVVRRCQRLAADREAVKGAVGFHWAGNLEK